MTTEQLQRCATLMAKIKRGPVWDGVLSIFRLRFDKQASILIKEISFDIPVKRWERADSRYQYHHHEAACILEKWLRGELRDAGYGVSAWPDGTVNVWRQKHGESLCIVCNSNELTALIETAEKVLL